MKNEQLAMEILRELVKNAALTITTDNFEHWYAHRCGYRCSYSDGPLDEAFRQLNRLRGIFDEEEIKKLFDEVEESYRAGVGVDPQVWALFKGKAEPAESDRPDAKIAENVDFLV
jgi:hypothetical protein